MVQPTLKSFAAEVYERIAPLAYDDANQAWSLANYISGIGEMFQVVEDYSRDQLVDGSFAPGWSQMVDINRVPTAALPWLAQFVGVRLPAGLSDAEQRSRIQHADGWKRGTPGSMIAIAQSYLTGTKTVLLRERDAGPYQLTINTRTSETPDPVALSAALQSPRSKPAGLILVVQQIPGQDWQNVKDTWATFQDVKDNYATMQDLLYDNRGGAPVSPEFSAYYVLLLGGGS